MNTLRLIQTAENQDAYRLEITLEGESFSSQTITTRFRFHLTPQQEEGLRWYLEDFLQYPFDPAPEIAQRIEADILLIGKTLFQHVFRFSDEAKNMWLSLRPYLSDTRIEIVTGNEKTTAIPWELLCDPETETSLALNVRAFVQTHRLTPQQSLPNATGPIRILLVICRPKGRDDVPFRSVANRLLKGLRGSKDFQLDVLRPPTFTRLRECLHTAQAKGEAYHVVHFDGHGVYEDPMAKAQRQPPKKQRGYLLFEKADGGEELVHGTLLGKALMEGNVPWVILNACRSAHAEAPAQPGQALADNHTWAFGSLAQEVLATGVVGVVAMRYNIYVVTAAQFVADLYAALTHGITLGEAVTLGRKRLADDPMREIAYVPRRLQDWLVPMVYETTPLQLFSRATTDKLPTIMLQDTETVSTTDEHSPGLPKPPDVGVFGRDETLHALDRTFDRYSVALLYGLAGSGKSTAAVEFARWYISTGGVKGPALFTSFERPRPLVLILDQIGQIFGSVLEQVGIHWQTLNDADRREVALQLLCNIPILWIWDNVEQVAGFPSGATSVLSQSEQQELANFVLVAAQSTQAKFLLTSRRDERNWLGDLLQSISIPPMPIVERVQLAKALAKKRGQRLSSVASWWPLLRFTQGNPLTMTVVVGQALHNGLQSKEEIASFVEKLRAGETELDEDTSQGRTTSLSASLSYGLEHAFNEAERRQLALLHFFQGFVNVDALRTMGNPAAEWCLTEVRGLTREAGIALLERAAEIGLLHALGNGSYIIHPVLPWYFKRLYESLYPEDKHKEVAYAFVATIAGFGELHNIDYYETGQRDAVGWIVAEENNFLHARQLALTHDWWIPLVGIMQGLRILYEQAARWGEWGRLVEEVFPTFADQDTGDPMPGREEGWIVVTEYFVKLANMAQQWEMAEYLQRKRIAWDMQFVGPTLTIPPEALDEIQRRRIRGLAVSMEDLGNLLRDQGRPDCIEPYENAIHLFHHIGEQPSEATAAFNLGRAYVEQPSLRDLAKAEGWSRHSLRLRPENDQLGQARSLGQLGLIALEMFKDTETAKRPEPERQSYLQSATLFFEQALKRIPPNALNDLAVSHNALAAAYSFARNYRDALVHYAESIRYDEEIGNHYRAAETRLNVGASLMTQLRYSEALLYAQAALNTFTSYGQVAAREIQRAQALIQMIKMIEQAMKERENKKP